MIGLLGSLLGSQGGRMIGGMVGGRTGAMIGSMAGAMLGGRKLGSALGAGKSGLSGLLGGNKDDNSQTMTDSDAQILVRAMTNSAKADGHIDQTEIDHIVGELGEDVTRDEQEFLNNELSSPFLPPADIAKAVPAELSVDAYVVSLLSIEVDDGKEVAYLKTLADELGINNDDRDAIHDELGVDRI